MPTDARTNARLQLIMVSLEKMSKSICGRLRRRVELGGDDNQASNNNTTT
jgi:hypothetical protein